MSEAPERWPEHLRPVPLEEQPGSEDEHGEQESDGAGAVPEEGATPAGETRQPVPRALPGDGDEPTDEPAGEAPEEGGEREGMRGLYPPKTHYRPGRTIAEVVVELGMVAPEAVTKAAGVARETGRATEDVLLERGLLGEEQVAQAVAERYGHDYVDLGTFSVDMAAAGLLSVGAVRRYRAVPVAFRDGRTVLLAMAEPANVLALDDIQMMTGHDCAVAVSAPTDIETLIARLTSMESAVEEAVEEDEEEEGLDLTQLRSSADDAPVVKLVHGILAQAVARAASDIHLERDEGDMRIRFRVDGVLQEAATVPRRMIAGTISRLKIMSELDIAEKRVPQDGRVSVNVDDRKVDLRVTTLPTQRGEGCTVRILDKQQALLSLDKLGLDGYGRERYEAAIRRAHGAVLVTGPTGSGKSTTLYAALGEINAVERNIITIEDPVEYQLDGINQVNINPKAGLSFAVGLRSILRADPDVIMVGEIRDGETARIAIEAALTGHLVLSTLHTNDAPGAITRLAKMGIESFLTASSVSCVVAQRLARKLCPQCKEEAVIPQAALAESGFHVEADLEAYRPRGCARCNQSGYRGRVGLFSVMTMSERLKELTVSGAPEAHITTIARDEGMATLQDDGLAKVRAGVTSIEEVARVST
jgi:type IV pilus assembly protein PilB